MFKQYLIYERQFKDDYKIKLPWKLKDSRKENWNYLELFQIELEFPFGSSENVGKAHWCFSLKQGLKCPQKGYWHWCFGSWVLDGKILLETDPRHKK